MAWASAHLVYAAANSNPTAIATALIALGGALLGAVLSTGTQLLIAHRQARRDTAARSKEIMIAARMMAVDLSRARSNIQYWIDHHEWWRTTGLSPRVTEHDRRLVLGELSSSGFYNLDRAESAIDHWYSTQEYELAKNGSYSSSSITTQLDKLREIVGWIDEAGGDATRVDGRPCLDRGVPTRTYKYLVAY